MQNCCNWFKHLPGWHAVRCGTQSSTAQNTQPKTQCDQRRILLTLNWLQRKKKNKKALNYIFNSHATKLVTINGKAIKNGGKIIFTIPLVYGCCSIWSTPSTPDRRKMEWCRKLCGHSLHLCLSWRWDHCPHRQGWGRAAELPAPSHWPTIPPVWASGSHNRWYSEEKILWSLLWISDSSALIWVVFVWVKLTLT